MKINNIHLSIANKISRNKNIQKTILSIEKNPAYSSAIMCGLVGVVAKPITMIALPNKNEEMKKDNRYALARALSTGVLDFIFALAIFLPINKKIEKHGRELFDKRGSVYYKNKEMVSNAKSMINRGFRIASLPAFAFCKFFAIDPTIKILYKKDKNK